MHTHTLPENGAELVVSLTEGMPSAQGRTWTAEDYARRDARFAALGLQLAPRTSRKGHAR